MKKNTKIKSIRLPSYIKPERYILTLKPDLEAFIFTGKEIIEIIINKSTKEIILHAKNIKIETVEIIQEKNTQFADKIIYDEINETVKFIFKQIIKKGNAKLSIIFDGIINDTLRGFYRSRYEIQGITKYIATTQFEATDARRAFPCFDEPTHKAIFDISLIIPGSHTAISNTLPKTIQEHEAGLKIIEFASTPRMSTYLLAFIIGEFEFLEKRTKDNVQIRVFTTANKSYQAKFALDVAVKTIEFYNEYFDIPYPLPVLDLIAIPDFESAAMENWGAVTFRETAILVDEEKTSFSNKQWVAIVVAHELAHQWFGNLVTMEWWTDLWLNEGFASYMENLCIDKLFPKWHVWDLFLADRYSTALRLDSLTNSHPIEVVVNHPNEINEIFDMVSYAKGAAIIRQLSNYIGPEKFRDGLRYYLKKHSYKNTKTMHLWESFEKISKKPIKKLMQVWTKKAGYPLISISNNKTSNVLVRQERFFSSRISAKKNKDRTLWQIPINYDNNKTTLKTLITKKNTKIQGKSIGKINKGEESFIRVKYDTRTLEKLKKNIEDNLLSRRDRLGIIRDLFALAEGGYIKTTEVLEFSLAYKNEKEYIVWSEIALGINKIYNLIHDEPFKNLYKKYVCSLFSPLANYIGWEKHNNEEYSYTLLRNLALSQSAFYGDEKVIKHAKMLFENMNYNVIPADIRSVIYGIVASNGDIKEWLEFERLYRNETLHEEKDRYGKALTLFKDKVLLSRTLTFAISGAVRTQDSPFMISGVWQNTYGQELAWKFIKNNWKELIKKYAEGGHFLSRIIGSLGNHTKIIDALDAKKFFKKNSAPGADRTLEQAYERIYSNAVWLKDDKKDIQNWLKKNF